MRSSSKKKTSKAHTPVRPAPEGAQQGPVSSSWLQSPALYRSRSVIVCSVRPVGLPLQPPKPVQKTCKTWAEVLQRTRGKLPDLKHILLKSEESRETEERKEGWKGREEGEHPAVPDLQTSPVPVS